MSKLEREVGEKRTFSFSDDLLVIREVLDDPKISLFWTWGSGICHKCKCRLTRDVTHDFYRIEILVKEELKTEDAKVGDIIMVGDTMDKRKMLLPADKFNEVFEKSKVFKHLYEGAE